MKLFRLFHPRWWTAREHGHKYLYRKRKGHSWYEKFDLTEMGIKSHREFMKSFPKPYYKESEQ